MKNMIIASMSAYIFYGFCEIKSIPATVMMFLLIWILFEETDEQIRDFKLSVKRGQRLNDNINELKNKEDICTR